MVYYNPAALEDYSNILYGLLIWPKHPLEPEHARQYMRDIEKVCRALDDKIFHQQETAVALLIALKGIISVALCAGGYYRKKVNCFFEEKIVLL